MGSIAVKINKIKNEFDNTLPNLKDDKYSNLKTRSSGLELFRIIVMFIIVAHHYVVNSGLISNVIASNYNFSFNNLFLVIFGAWGKIGINCFVLITGYFMCKSNITLKKFLKLLFEVLFYNIVIYLIFLITGYERFNLISMIKTIVPVFYIGVSFISSFLVFYLFIPFINILIRNLNKTKHLLLIVLSLVVYTIIPNFLLSYSTFGYVWWFTVLYFISSYIRFYPLKIDDNKKVWRLSTVILVFLSVMSVLFGMYVSKVTNNNNIYFFIVDSNKLLALLVSISGFMLFKNMHFESKKINYISASTFGVLLIHANSDTMRSFLWGTLLQNTSYYDSTYLILHAIISTICVYIVCTALDFLRRRFVEKPLFIKYDKIYNKYVKGVK